MENFNYTVYIHISPHNKYYVGITSKKPEQRWKNGQGYSRHHLHFYNAIQKYGWENFQHEIIASKLTKEEACNFEKLLILNLNSNNSEYGYNLTTGGEHYTPNQESRKKMSERQIGEKNHNFGKHLSEEYKEKISKSSKGRKLTEEHKQKISEAHKGKTVSKELIIKLSIFNKGKKRIIGQTQMDNLKQKTSQRFSKPTNQIDILTNEIIMTYPSATKAALENGFCRASITQCCAGRTKTAYGYKWKYVDKTLNI